MFERLAEVVKDYNNSGRGTAVLQKYDANTRKAFILCIITNLICRVHQKIRQAGELYYMDASSSFKPLNTSITLFYTSCAGMNLFNSLINIFDFFFFIFSNILS